MRTKIRWAYPSVASSLAMIYVFLAIVACRQASNFEGGNKDALIEKEVMLVEPPPPQSPKIRYVPPVVKDADDTHGDEQPQKIDVVERKVIKTGNVRFKTRDLQKTRQGILNAVNTFKGYVSEEGQTGNGVSSEMSLTVCVPAPLFDSLLTIIGSNAEYFDSKNIHTQDVTEEYIDVATRIRTKKTLENQYMQVLKQAKSVKEIMDVERELNTVREQIESAEGRMRYLSSQVSFSTLTLAFYVETVSGGSPRSFWARLGDGFVEGWQSLLSGIVWFFGAWPTWLVLGILGFGVRRFLQWRRQKAGVD